MLKILWSFIKYYLFWLLFCVAFKVFFLLYNFSAAAGLPAADLWGIFRHGIVMDLSVAGYFSALPGLIFTLGFLWTPRLGTQILRYYTLLVLIVLTLIGLGDAGLYPAWGSRLNAQVLLYLENPGGIYASMTWYQLILFPLCWAGIVWGCMWCYKRLLPTSQLRELRLPLWGAPVMLLFTAVLIIPIRGGLDRAPLNHSKVYFSENIKANQFAYNFFWNFIHDVMKNSKNKVEVNYMSTEEAKAILEAKDKEGEEAPQLIYPEDGKPVNIVVVFLESFSDKIIEPLGGMKGVTPNLNAFCEEGIAFDSFYSTGNRSDKGMSAFIGGRPSDMSAYTSLAFPEKMKNLDYLPRYFADQDYNMSFYYGGDVNFYNTRAVMIQSGMKKIVSKEEFPLETGLKQKWGVPDEFLYARLFEDLKQEPEPYFSMVYNISSHEPFDVEKDFNRFDLNTIEGRYLNSAFYADSCLGVFVDSLKQLPSWKNTLVVVTADHTSLQPGPTTVFDQDSYRIPLIMLGGVVKNHALIHRIGNHNDFGPMLLKQLGLKHKKDLLSKDFLSDDSYAFYFRGEGWAFISPEIGWFYNVQSRKTDYYYNFNPANQDSIMNFARAYVQYLHDLP